MVLIADSGSTKTDWVVADGGVVKQRVQTEGINPFVQSDDVIRKILSSLLSQLSCETTSIAALYFYGAGIRGQMQERMQALLQDVLRTEIFVASDLLGAARALFGNGEGIASILGTGSNSCLYDGTHIIQNTPPLGYILGDEGSGAVLGRLFINALFKKQLPDSLREEFLSDTGQDMEDIIYKVYKQPMANRYLAASCKFIHQHLDCEPLRQLVVENFRAFFTKNIAPYQHPHLAVSAVGSIAYYFEKELRDAANLEGYKMATIVQSPIDGLVAYHASL